MSTPRKVKSGYWVQTLHSVICPDGSAYDYYFSKKEATKVAKELNTRKATK